MAKNNHPELVAQLTEGISTLTSSEEWQRYLDFRAAFTTTALGTFPHCRPVPRGNSVAASTPGGSSIASSAKGEKAIWVLAPMVYKNADAEDGETIGSSELQVRACIRHRSDRRRRAAVHLQPLEGDDPKGRYAQLVTVRSVYRLPRSKSTNSTEREWRLCHAEHRIRVETTNTPRTGEDAAHELAHALLHESYDNRALAELEAESTAYVVCQTLGIDSGDYSFGYVATWAGDGEQAIAGIRASCDRIQKSAAAILQALEPVADDEAA